MALFPMVQVSAEMQEKPYMTDTYSVSAPPFISSYPFTLLYCSSKHFSLYYWFVIILVPHYNNTAP